jgi:hypothetical protein
VPRASRNRRGRHPLFGLRGRPRLLRRVAVVRLALVHAPGEGCRSTPANNASRAVPSHSARVGVHTERRLQPPALALRTTRWGAPRSTPTVVSCAEGGRYARQAVRNHSARGRASRSRPCGIAAVWVAWPRTSNTSPLAALLALLWSCTYVVTALLTWRRSRLAAPAFLAALALLPALFSFIFPGGQVLLLPLFAVTFLFALLGYRYLRRPREPAA